MTMSQSSSAMNNAQDELTITWIFGAPRQRVFQAWTDCNQLMRWWGPRGFTAPICEIDPRVGGESFNCMRSPDGRNYCSKGTIREIVPNERLVYTDSFADEQGNLVPATYYGMSADFPTEMLVTVTFEDADGMTRVTVRHTGIPRGQDRDGALQGWSESFVKLADYLDSLAEEMQSAA